MKKSNILPKKLIFFAVFVSITYLSAIISLSLKISSQFESINNVHLPLLEMSAINIRLGDSLKSKTKILIYDYQIENLEEYEKDKDSLSYNLKNYYYLLSSSDLQLKFEESLNRNALFSLEESAIELSRKGKSRSALTVLKSGEYMREQSHFTNSIQTVAEQLSQQRDLFLKEQGDLIRFAIIYSVLAFIFIGFLWTKIYLSFTRNSKEKAQAIEDLISEKAKSSHVAKMASLGEMAAGIAHEINNPLAIINGYSDKIIKSIDRKDFDSEKLKRYASKISKSSWRIGSMVESLKTFSKKNVTSPTSLTDVKEIIEDTLNLCRERFKTSGIELNVIYDKATPSIINVCPVEISQVLLTLLNNSYDELSSIEINEGSVTIGATQDGDSVYISVEDNGRGVSEDFRDKLFNPFFTTKEVSDGTGLGLSISNSIIEKHKGELYLDKINNKKFVIKLPISSNLAPDLGAA